jgi:hypothetical protein
MLDSGVAKTGSTTRRSEDRFRKIEAKTWNGLPFLLVEADLLEFFFSFFAGAFDGCDSTPFLSRPLLLGYPERTYLDLGIPVRGGCDGDSMTLDRRRKSYLEVGFSSARNRVRLDVGGGKSAEVESVGEVASDGARYLRLLEMVEGGEGSVRRLC